MATAGLTGCPPPPEPPPEPRPLARILDGVQANRVGAAGILYAPLVLVSASLRDDDGTRHVLDLRGRLVMRGPRDIFLRLDHPLESDQIWLGSNAKEYWVAIRRGFQTMWIGRHDHVGKPCVESLPIDPPRIADALGMQPLPRLGELGPYRICEADRDRLIYGRKDAAGRVRVDRQYFIDRRPPFLVRGIEYLDDFGRVDLRVTLDRHQSISPDDARFARRIELSWPTRESWMRIDIVGLERRDRVHPRTFERPEPPDGITDLRRIDQACDDESSEPAPLPGSVFGPVSFNCLETGLSPVAFPHWNGP